MPLVDDVPSVRRGVCATPWSERNSTFQASPPEKRWSRDLPFSYSSGPFAGVCQEVVATG